MLEESTISKTITSVTEYIGKNDTTFWLLSHQMNEMFYVIHGNITLLYM